MYLSASLSTALNIDDDNIEVIVADNASTDNTREVVEEKTDQRLIYLPSDRRMSMRENFNRSVCASSGDYVLFIGDDDSVMTNQFRYLRRILEEKKPDGFSWFRATYGWPIEDYGNKTGGIRFYRKDAFGPPISYNPQDDLDALLHCKLGLLNPTPAIYHGCVSRQFLDKIAPAPGVFFDSTIPDVNFQYRCIYLGGKFLHANHPFTINGYSPASTGGAHSAVKPDSLGAKIGRSFTAENRADSYEDIIDHALAIQLVFFSTLETLRERGGFTDPVPQYTDWYQYALSATRMKPEQAVQIEETLASYAKRTGTQEQLRIARSRPAHAKRTLSERLLRARSQISSFRLSAEQDSLNTVLTATNVCDAVLGSDFGAVLDNTMSTADAWRAAKRRSKEFSRQL